MDAPDRPPVPSRALLLVIAAALAACGGSAPVVTPDIAEGLAARADQVASLAEAGDECGALDELAALRADADTATQDRSLPSPAHEELVAAADGIGAALTCEDPDDEDDDEGDDEPSGSDDSEGKSKGKAKGKAKGKSKDDG